MKGIFKPINFMKYKGDPTNIIYRSGWELKCMSRFDLDPNIIWWQSEELVIRYRSPIDNKIHRYFVDFIIHYKDVNGKFRTALIEVKPKKQTVPPVKTGKKQKTYIQECLTWGVNQAKWNAAKAYCDDRGYDFLIWTEDTIF